MELRDGQVRIDKLTGDLVIDQERFGPRLREHEFLSSALGMAAKKVRSAGSRNYYEAWRQINQKYEFGLTFGFASSGSLERISAQFVPMGARGSNWSKAIEDEIKRFHDSWLEEQLGHLPYQFQWGRVLSAIEPHWYSANIVIDYTKKK